MGETGSHPRRRVVAPVLVLHALHRLSDREAVETVDLR